MVGPQTAAVDQPTQSSASAGVANRAGAEKIALVGTLPQEAHKDIAKWLGVYTKRAELTNGRPSYEKEGDRMIWWTGKTWLGGLSKNLGSTLGGIFVREDAASLELVTRCLLAADGKGSAVSAPDIQVFVPPAAQGAPEAPQPPREDQEVRKRVRWPAIDLEECDKPRKRNRMPTLELEARVARARASTEESVSTRAAQLLASAVEEFARNKIHAGELQRRKELARAQAVAENPRRRDLDAAIDAYRSVIRMREAAMATYSRAVSNEGPAEAALNKAIAALEPQDPLTSREAAAGALLLAAEAPRIGSPLTALPIGGSPINAAQAVVEA